MLGCEKPASSLKITRVCEKMFIVGLMGFR